MSSINTDVNQDQVRDFRTYTASTKVTEAEFNELEQAAAANGVRLGEWIRDILFREIKSPNPTATEQLMTEIVALQLFLSNALSPVVCGEKMSIEQYQELLKNVKTHKRSIAREMLAAYLKENKEESHA